MCSQLPAEGSTLNQHEFSWITGLVLVLPSNNDWWTSMVFLVKLLETKEVLLFRFLKGIVDPKTNILLWFMSFQIWYCWMLEPHTTGPNWLPLSEHNTTKTFSRISSFVFFKFTVFNGRSLNKWCLNLHYSVTGLFTKPGQDCAQNPWIHAPHLLGKRVFF